MDVQDHKTTPSSGGHEGHGVHLCHKCGWPFPNPHPSAKHRRAHKRVCGKIEGYKLIDLENDHISDNDHLSDDDKTPSPKVKGNVKELGSSDGICLKSNKSEDDMFSDAVTEFSDSGVSPNIEELLESVRELDKSVGEEQVHELNNSQQSEDKGTNDTTKQLDDLTTGMEIFNAEDVGSVTNQSESTKPVTDNRVEEVSLGVDRTDGQQIDSSSMEYETISVDINENAESGKQKEIISAKPESGIEVKECISEVASFTESVALLSKAAGEAPLSESKSAEAEGGGSGPVVLESMVHEVDRKVSDTMTMEPKLLEADGNISHATALDEIFYHDKELSNTSKAEVTNVSTVSEIVDQEKGVSNVLQAAMAKNVLSPQIESPKCTDTSVTTQVEADSAKDPIGVGHDERAVVYDLKEGGDKEVHLVSVAETLPALGNPVIMTGEFKDYKVLRPSFPLDLGDAEVTRSVEDDNEVNLPESDPSSISSVPVGSLGTSHSYFNSLDNILVKEGVLAHIGGEVDTSRIRVISEEGSGTNGFEGSPGTSGFETQKSQPNYCIQGFQPNSVDEESSQDGVLASSSIQHSDVISAVSSIDEETCRQTTNLSNFETAADTVTTTSDHVRTETNHSLDEDNTSSYKKCTDEVSVEASQGIDIGRNTEVQKSGDGVLASSSIQHSDVISAVSSIDEETCRQTTNLSNFETAADSVTTTNDHVRTETNHSMDEDNTSSYKKCTDEVSVEASQGIDIGRKTEVQKSGDAFGVHPDLSPEGHSVASGKQSENSEMETQRFIAAVSQLKPEDHGVISDKNSQDSRSKEAAAALTVTSTVSSQSSATVEDKIARDAVTSEPLLDEGDGKLTKECLNVSAVDMSVVSSSRTESLDGNWGSVSVLSTQSDGTALADAETLSSVGAQATEKSEATLLKPQTSTQEFHPDKSDVFEPPSFMTLVESGFRDDKKAAASDTHDVQKTEQPKSEDLQAGWFPSLTNVINESEGRKKNEEIIAKVTNWSTGKQHSQSKNFLSEAQTKTKVKSAGQKQIPPANQANETASKNNGAGLITVSSIMESETPADNAATREMEKEWNSPARYPAEIKKEKKKGKPHWVPFVCCTSVPQDM